MADKKKNDKEALKRKSRLQTLRVCFSKYGKHNEETVIKEIKRLNHL